MKATNIDPGTVKVSEDGNGFTYTIKIRCAYLRVERSFPREVFPTASAAKQAMRETVSTLRRQHGCQKGGNKL